MKIRDVSVLLHERTWTHPFASPTGRMTTGVLTIETDEGLGGHTFVAGPGGDCGQQIIGVLKPMLVGRDPLAIGAIWADMWARRRLLSPMAMGAVDVALWDIAGKVAGLPVHRLLGSCKDKVPAYFSSFFHATPEAFAEEAAHWREQGLKGYKLHPPTQRRRGGEAVPVAEDIDACVAVRDAVGNDMALMLDSAWAYTYDEALTVGRAIEELGYAWYEDPLDADDLYGYTRLKRHLHIPIVATEVTEGGVFALPAWIEARATDALRGDVAIKGGITGLMKIAHLAEAFHLPFEVHDAYTSVNNVATLHVIAASATAQWFEMLPFNLAGQTGMDHFWYGLATPPRIDADGFAHVPDTPGIGADIDWDLIRSSVTATLR
ncbi:MAG TPA: enolase C-terminal domain-like protein [Baekduia sp.]|nr:enolase C-terminal domain-like protein [Baekduia sp.]